MIAYGPVPSRRLGRSIGINNIPPKTCTYSCVYCQLGRTKELSLERRPLYRPEMIHADTKKLVQRVRSKNERIDYLTFVPDGEPTLDINLQREIELLHELEIPIAVITNASLIWQSDVKEALFNADLVSLKVDTVTERIWRRINRPNKQLSLERILDGITQFSDQYNGTIITETMLIDGVDYSKEANKISVFLAGLNIKKAYIAVPTRPPAEDWVRPAKEALLNKAFIPFSNALGSNRVELLIGYEGDAFSSTGNLEEDLLSITSVHPMRKDAVERLVDRSDASWEQIIALTKDGKLIELTYEGEKYYMRKIASR